jgi:hypothetical protein
MPASATNSACLVPLRVRFVSFMPRPKTSPSLTKTQPTGVSSLLSASSACRGPEVSRPRYKGKDGLAGTVPHHVDGLAHEALVIRPLGRVHVVCVVICSRGLAGLRLVVRGTEMGVCHRGGRCALGRAKQRAHVCFRGQHWQAPSRKAQVQVKPKTTGQNAGGGWRSAQCVQCGQARPLVLSAKHASPTARHSLAARYVELVGRTTPTPSAHRAADLPGTDIRIAATRCTATIALRVASAADYPRRIPASLACHCLLGARLSSNTSLSLSL